MAGPPEGNLQGGGGEGEDKGEPFLIYDELPHPPHDLLAHCPHERGQWPIGLKARVGRDAVAGDDRPHRRYPDESIFRVS